MTSREVSSSDSVLVTGAGGFIGSHLVEALAKTGANVSAMVHYNSRNNWGNLEDLDKEVLESIKVISGDIRDPYFMRSAMRSRNIVFHLAALIAIPYSYEAPASYIATNVNGTLNVLQVARELELERLVLASTSEVYGTAQYFPMDEQHPLQAQSPYSASKIAADKLAESFHASFGLPVVTVRPFNTFGPRQSARAIVPTIATQAMAGERIRLGRLSPVRDMNFVSDTVNGFLLASKAHAKGTTVNLGSGIGISIGDLARKIFAILGVEPTIEEDPERIRPEGSEIMQLVASAERAKRLLGWSSQVSLNDGLSDTLEWLLRHRHRYKTETYNR
jgi:NAD dependent epimerase/dehydratase